MITNNHYIELYINGELIELENQESLNLRINNVLFNPTKTSTTQAEYSFSFDIPSTPSNDRVLGYANNLSRINKFRARYNSQIYADGTPIFDGSLTIQKYNAKDKMYTCNLVNFKVNTLDEIFGETKLTDLHWDVDFDGANTINSVNADMNSKYFFPLASYGVFQKKWKAKDEVAAEYTPKHDIDKYNKWWIESFYPSLNVMETVKRAFEAKGYNAIGSAFLDPNIKTIYASCNLANEQSPIYNLGNPKFGHLHITTNWTNSATTTGESTTFGGNTFRVDGGVPQDLNFPYEGVSNVYPGFQGSKNTSRMVEYNFSTIDIWNMLDTTNNPNGVTATLHEDSYIYDPGENVIVIPADGWYKIKLTCNAVLNNPGVRFDATQWTNKNGNELVERTCSINRDFQQQTPLEIQLIRNYNENIELIKGSNNIRWYTGDPTDLFYRVGQNNYQNKHTWTCEYPHQDLYANEAPTKTEAIGVTTAVTTNEYGNFGGNRQNKTTNSSNGASQNNTKGYVHSDGYPMPYDQYVSPAFICGVSSLGNGTASVMKNGKSWNKQSSEINKVFAKVKGLNIIYYDNSLGVTDHNENSYNDSPNITATATTSAMSGSVYSCVYLNKNDILELVAIQRDFNSTLGYTTSATCDLEITAITDRTYEVLKGDQYFGYYSSTEFPTKLNLFNFTNKEMKVSDWLTNIQKAFNLEFVMDGNTVDVNVNKGIKKYITNAISIDDRVNSDEAEAEFISYPKEMSVQYKIDTDEWGFWTTVPAEYHNAEESVWKEHGDSGYTVIQLNDDSYETSTQNTSTQFSYTWYDNFNFQQVDSGGTSLGDEITITIPVIEKYDYMAEGYDYEESMKHDGYSLTQRFWFRDQVSQEYVYLSSIKANGSKEYIDLVYPINSWKGFNLSYKDTEMSLVTEYFNVSPMLSSNYVNVDVYLTPDEYRMIKGGALVNFDSDLYYVSEISGFDPSGGNTTKLKLIKKI